MQQQISYKIIQIINDKHINEKIYKLGNGKIFSFTNQPAQEHLGPIPSIALNISFQTINILYIVVELPQNIIPYFIREWNV